MNFKTTEWDFTPVILMLKKGFHTSKGICAHIFCGIDNEVLVQFPHNQYELKPLSWEMAAKIAFLDYHCLFKDKYFKWNWFIT